MAEGTSTTSRAPGPDAAPAAPSNVQVERASAGPLLPAPVPATRYEIAAWILTAVALLLIFHLHFVSALVPGLLVHALMHKLTGRFRGQGLSSGRAKLLSLAVLGSIAAGITTAVVFTTIGLFKGRVLHLPQLYEELAKAIDVIRLWVVQNVGSNIIPEADANQIREAVHAWLKEHSKEFGTIGFEEARGSVHAVIGIIIAALISFEAGEPSGPLGVALYERVRRIAQAFERIVFAQVKISALNTTLTTVYLFGLLPLFGVKLDHRITLIAVTFIAGLLPVVGNLISNTIIVVLSFKYSAGAALGSLTYLVVIHKLEYFLNARIVGGEIHAAAWEILLAMVLFEAIFGVPGLIMAPIIYAYVKQELVDRHLL